jgi:hypothetical protein
LLGMDEREEKMEEKNEGKLWTERKIAKMEI